MSSCWSRAELGTWDVLGRESWGDAQWCAMSRGAGGEHPRFEQGLLWLSPFACHLKLASKADKDVLCSIPLCILALALPG